MANSKIDPAVNSGIGKSSLLRRFTDRWFEPVHTITVGAEYRFTTAGAEVFRPITRATYVGAAGALLVYDITRRETFENLRSLLEGAWQKNTNTTIMVIGNKCDMDGRRAITTEEGQEFAKKYGLLFMETSPKTAHNMDKAFIQTASTIYTRIHGDGSLDKSNEVTEIFGAAGPLVRRLIRLSCSKK